MTPSALLLLVVFVACLLLNVPVALAITGAAFVAINALDGVDAGPLVARKVAEGVESFSLLAILFFILAGHLMGAGGMATRRMSLAGLIPGVLVGLMLIGVCFLMSFGSAAGTGQWGGLRRVGRDFLLAVPSLLLVLIVLRGILGGVFSATESAAIAVLYTFLVPGIHWGIDRLVLKSPPVGTCLLLGCGIGDTTIANLTKMMLPFYAAMVAALLLITFVPELSLA